MFINKIGSTVNYYSNMTARNTSATSARGVQWKDQFALSKEAQSFSEMMKKLKSTPEVRQDKVNDLAQKISSGQYNVSAEDIALSLLTNRY